MDLSLRWRTWAEAHRAEALGLVRVYLGLGLFARGLYFLTDSGAYFALMPEDGAGFLVSGVLLHYVALAHLGGGLLLAMGLLTRLAALVQVPILAGAVLLVHRPSGLLGGDQSFELAAMVLFLLVLFALWGGGPWSLDALLARRAETEREREEAAIAANVRRLHEHAIAPAADRSPLPPAPPIRAAEAPPRAATEHCSCDRDIHHPDVAVERHYGFPGVLPFVAGVTATPTRLTFRCRTCGEVILESSDPELLLAHRYEQHPGPAS